MQPTIYRRITLPPLGLQPTSKVNSVARGYDDTPARVVIKNTSGAVAFFGTASESMIGPDAPGVDVFEIPPGEEGVFVLAPRETLFGCANGAGAIISIAISEALPTAVAS